MICLRLDSLQQPHIGVKDYHTTIWRIQGEGRRIGSAMARRPDERDREMLSEENLNELRHNLAHLSLPAVREFYELAYRDCRLVYDHLPRPRQIQTLVQVWKRLWKWR
jgi:hypothetical protein